VWVRLRAKWAVLPVWAKWVLALYMIGFADGTADHVRWMTHGGIHAYASSYPQVPIQVFFVILVVADPLIVVLLGLVRREGIWLACAVMVLDLVANWVGNWSRIRHDPGLNVPWLITLFGVFVLACAPPLLLVWREGAAVTPEAR
jgi:hypothetical protein